MGGRPLRPPTHRRPGGPLPRRLANGTHAPPPPSKLSPPRDAPERAYAVLVRVSPGYPPVAGGLHTRYAPVRRSPARHCCRPLPLDLHVLGLPLAFILSQDQTLRCNYPVSAPSPDPRGSGSELFFSVCIRVSLPLRSAPPPGRASTSLASCCLLTQYVIELSRLPARRLAARPSGSVKDPRSPGSAPPLSFPFGGAKVCLFFQSAKS